MQGYVGLYRGDPSFKVSPTCGVSFGAARCALHAVLQDGDSQLTSEVAIMLVLLTRIPSEFLLAVQGPKRQYKLMRFVLSQRREPDANGIRSTFLSFSWRGCSSESSKPQTPTFQPPAQGPQAVSSQP